MLRTAGALQVEAEWEERQNQTLAAWAKGSPLFRPEGRNGPWQPSCDPQKSPDTPGSLEGNTEGPGDGNLAASQL